VNGEEAWPGSSLWPENYGCVARKEGSCGRGEDGIAGTCRGREGGCDGEL